MASDVRFSICAITDLLGFSSHLEVGGNDLRTTIGEQAIRRLENLERGIALIEAEAASGSEFSPPELRMRRINDALFCTLDLDDLLLPSIGNTGFTGSSVADVTKHFNLESFDNAEGFAAAYDARLQQAIRPLLSFLGLIARLHLFIQKREAQSVLPGARTIISTGFRLPFRSKDDEDDALSANFALANAHAAEKSLHGAHLFVENNVIELCSRDRFSRNLLRFSCYDWTESEYDCLREGSPREGLNWRQATEVSSPQKLMLFRRNYMFRRLNPSPLSYLQHLTLLRESLEAEPGLQHSNPYFAHIVSAIKIGVTDRRVEACNPPKSFLYGGSNDLESSIIEFRELFLTGELLSRVRQQRLENLQKAGRPELIDNPKFIAEMDKLDEQTVEIDLEPVTPAELGDMVWRFDAAQLTGMLPLFNNDYSGISFPED